MGGEGCSSLPAFAKLGREKGYRLVGTTSLGINAFFVRNDVGIGLLPELTPRQCFDRVTPLQEYHPSWLAMMYADGQTWDEV
jgi:hypothetical protein